MSFFNKKKAPDFEGIKKWFNSNPVSISELEGKVVLIDFWTYSCINCLRTLAALKEWHEKYSSSGLVIVGVHSPEFDFEKNPENVFNAIKRMGIKYPVAVDSDMETWKAFSNNYWPAKYLINKNGEIIYTHFGEGGYEETERQIQAALDLPKQNSKSILPDPKTSYSIDQSQEIYAGFTRNEGLGSGLVCDKNGCDIYVDSEQNRHTPNILYPTGQWVQEPESLNLKSSPGKLALRFYARQINLVVSIEESLVELVPFIDGKQLPTISADHSGMYTLWSNEHYAEHEIEIVFKDKIKVYAFTFG